MSLIILSILVVTGIALIIAGILLAIFRTSSNIPTSKYYHVVYRRPSKRSKDYTILLSTIITSTSPDEALFQLHNRHNNRDITPDKIRVLCCTLSPVIARKKIEEALDSGR